MISETDRIVFERMRAHAREGRAMVAMSALTLGLLLFVLVGRLLGLNSDILLSAALLTSFAAERRALMLERFQRRWTPGAGMGAPPERPGEGK